jgi:hypothetical protein
MSGVGIAMVTAAAFVAEVGMVFSVSAIDDIVKTQNITGVGPVSA